MRPSYPGPPRTRKTPPHKRRARCGCAVLLSVPIKRPSHVGNGVLLRLGESYFVLTAAHNFDHLAGHQTLLAMRHHVFPVWGDALANTLPPDIKRENNPIDLGVLRITKGLPSEAAADALTESDLEIRVPAVPDETPYLLVGAPGNKSHISLKPPAARFPVRKYTAPEAAELFYGIVKRERYPQRCVRISSTASSTVCLTRSSCAVKRLPVAS